MTKLMAAVLFVGLFAVSVCEARDYRYRSPAPTVRRETTYYQSKTGGFGGSSIKEGRTTYYRDRNGMYDGKTVQHGSKVYTYDKRGMTSNPRR